VSWETEGEGGAFWQGQHFTGSTPLAGGDKWHIGEERSTHLYPCPDDLIWIRKSDSSKLA